MRGRWHCHLSVCSDPLPSSAARCPNEGQLIATREHLHGKRRSPCEDLRGPRGSTWRDFMDNSSVDGGVKLQPPSSVICRRRYAPQPMKNTKLERWTNISLMPRLRSLLLLKFIIFRTADCCYLEPPKTKITKDTTV